MSGKPEYKTAEHLQGLCEAFDVQPHLEQSIIDPKIVYVNVEKTITKIHDAYYRSINNGFLSWREAEE